MLIEQIKADQVAARKAHNADMARLLTTFYSEAAMIGKNDGDRLTADEEVVALAKKFVKNAKEVVDSLPEDDDRVESALFEIKVLETFLPLQMSEPDLQKFISDVISDQKLSSPRDKGVIMKELKAKKLGLYDGGKASQLADALLAGF